MKKQPEKKPELNPFEPLEIPTHKMTDAQLIARQSDMDAALSGAMSGVVIGDADDKLDDEAEDEFGDLIEHVSATDYRSLSEALREDEVDLEE